MITSRETCPADVIVVGAGPTGLMLACELRLAGVHVLVLDRLPEPGTIAKAYGLGGQILQLLHYRGLLERFEAGTHPSRPASGFPFGNVHVDFSGIDDPPLWRLGLSQVDLERLLGGRARELGAEILRGHEVVALNQDDAHVSVDVLGPDGAYRTTAPYLVGCDGPSSSVRDMAGFRFPGITYPEVNRLGQVALGDSVIRLENGDLDVPGLGRIRAGFTATGRGVFAFGWLSPNVLLVQTTENDSGAADETPMRLNELEDSVRRILGGNLVLKNPTRLSRYRFEARQVERYRDGRILLAGDAAHLFPATGSGLNVSLLDTVNLAWKLAAEIHGWAPSGLLDTYHSERHFAGARTMLQTQAQVALRRGNDPAAEALRKLFLELLTDEQPLRRMGALLAGTDVRYALPNADEHALIGSFVPDLTLRTERGAASIAELMRVARPVFLDLAGRRDLRDAARDRQSRIDVHVARTPRRPADALLIRPDAHIAWAARINQSTETAVPALRDALCRWFGH